MIFRAIWPITDPTMTTEALMVEALHEAPVVARRHHAELLGPGRFHRLPSARVAGSGRATEECLVYEAPAKPMAERAYWKARKEAV